MAETGETVVLGRLTEPGDCTLWLDEGGIHFQRENSPPQLIPRRCLQSATLRRQGLSRVVDITWAGAFGDLWVSRFTSRAADWPAAVEKLMLAR